MIVVDERDVGLRLDEIMAEVAGGGTVAIHRNGQTVARVVPENDGLENGAAVPASAIEAMEKIRALRSQGPRLSRDEVLALVREGRRY